MQNNIITRDQYMSGEVSHYDYFLAMAKRCGITLAVFSPKLKEKIAASTCEHLNDIGLAIWDRLPASVCEYSASGKRSTSPSIKVCALKALANEYRTNYRAVLKGAQ